MLPQETRMQALRLIKQYPYPGAEVEGIMGLLDAGYRMEFEHGQTICSEGDPATCMYILTYGRVSVIKSDFQGKPRRVATMAAPSIFGHMAMVDGSPRSATCTSEGIVTVVVLDRECYQRLITAPDAPGRTLRRLLLSSLTDQLSRGNMRIRELTGGPVAAAEATPTPPKEVTQEELANISSELEGWRRRAVTQEGSSDGLQTVDVDGPMADEAP